MAITHGDISVAQRCGQVLRHGVTAHTEHMYTAIGEFGAILTLVCARWQLCIAGWGTLGVTGSDYSIVSLTHQNGR